jgi:hypothetical protein
MKTTDSTYREVTKVCLEKMNGGDMNASQEVIETYMEKREAKQEKLQTKVEVYPERIEANQEKTGVSVEHYNLAPCVKDKHLPPCRAEIPTFYMEFVKE